MLGLQRESRNLSETDWWNTDESVIGVSVSTSQLKSFIHAQSQQALPILFIGEPGLRQEQLARLLHRMRGLPRDAFQVLSVRSHSHETLYRLLFASSGLLEAPHDGTILIDDLAALSGPLQYRLALSIEEQHQQIREGKPAGWRLIFTADAATEGAADDLSSSYLFKVLKPFSFRLVPLRERSEDIPYLANYLVEQLCGRLGKGPHHLKPVTLALLSAYNWQCNIDELAAILESAIAHTPPVEIGDELLPARIRYAKLDKIPEEGIKLSQVLKEYERSLINTAMQQSGEVQTKAARLLGMREQTLNMKLKRLGMQRQQQNKSSTAETEATQV